MGHNLASGLTTVVSLAACRNARRTGADLAELVESVDQALAQWLPDQFCTGVLTQLDLAIGELRWINCGHPAPLLIRDQRLMVDAMERDADPPWDWRPPSPHRRGASTPLELEPGDRVLMYTDGVTEARTGTAENSDSTGSPTTSSVPPRPVNSRRRPCAVSSTSSSTPRTTGCVTTPRSSCSSGVRRPAEHSPAARRPRRRVATRKLPVAYEELPCGGGRARGISAPRKCSGPDSPCTLPRRGSSRSRSPSTGPISEVTYVRTVHRPRIQQRPVRASGVVPVGRPGHPHAGMAGVRARRGGDAAQAVPTGVPALVALLCTASAAYRDAPAHPAIGGSARLSGLRSPRSGRVARRPDGLAAHRRDRPHPAGALPSVDRAPGALRELHQGRHFDTLVVQI
ncbi:PP2C family protein-serine/threonine phosphatase [Streptomyces sp. KL116D]|uniref:PP2C family protein-serine/threonine phosphatase n=1 Tax=Streptomyces sp. KL116D TaxID=3045152 RepID=UPI003557B960